jgi:hypothetical protein
VDLSKRFIGSGLYAIAIGRANCKPSPVAEDILVIRFYSAQKGEDLNLIAEKYGTKSDFLRKINDIDISINLLPTDQILILPGRCGG